MDELSQRDHVTYGKLMLALTERSMDEWTDKQGERHDKLNLVERAIQIKAWAEHYESTRPELAEALYATARQYLDMQKGMIPKERKHQLESAREHLLTQWIKKNGHEHEQKQDIGQRQ